MWWALHLAIICHSSPHLFTSQGQMGADAHFQVLFLKILLCTIWCIEVFFYSDVSSSPCHWKTVPQLLQPPAHFTFGMVKSIVQVMMRSACFPSYMKLLEIEVDQIREYCFSQSEGPLGAFLQIPSLFSCVFTEERVWPQCHKVQIGGVLQWCLGFSHLHIWSWSSTRVTIRLLVTSLDKALLRQLLSLTRRPALGRVLVVPNFFH